MTNTYWDDFHIAYQVAQCGSLSKAGKILNLNHATVLRHVNQLEEQLGNKLFIRHQRGYRLTDAGQLLVAELPNIIERFNRLENLMANTKKNVAGNLTITTVSDNAAMLTHTLMEFRNVYPKLRIKLISSDEILPLATGAAHVSLRAGKAPKDPDSIARKIIDIRFDYYASKQYIKQHGELKNLTDANKHDWVLPSNEKQGIPIVSTIINTVQEDRIVYQSNSFVEVYKAIEHGIGIGPIAEHQVNNYKDIYKLSIPVKNPGSALWFVYHRDLKENARVKALYDFLIKHFI